MNKQVELTLPAAKLFEVRFSFIELVIWKGNPVKQKVRASKKFAAMTEGEAKVKARESFDQEAYADFKRAGHDIASMQNGDRIKIPRTFKLREGH